MYNANKPAAEELPSAARLLRSTALAIVAAAAILVTAVLPAEYGLDPTGAGRILGLTEMGEIKTQLAAEAEADRRLAAEAEAAETPVTAPQAEVVPPASEPAAVEPGPAVAESAPVQSEGPGKALPAESPPEAMAEAPAEAAPEPEAWRDEISITLSPGQGTEVKLVMEAGAQARFQWTANGGRLNYDTHGNGGGQSISYEKGRGVPGDEGVLVAAFDGDHGWFWRNRTDKDVTLTLRASGAYREMKRVL